MGNQASGSAGVVGTTSGLLGEVVPSSGAEGAGVPGLKGGYSKSESGGQGIVYSLG